MMFNNHYHFAFFPIDNSQPLPASIVMYHFQPPIHHFKQSLSIIFNHQLSILNNTTNPSIPLSNHPVIVSPAAWLHLSFVQLMVLSWNFWRWSMGEVVGAVPCVTLGIVWKAIEHSEFNRYSLNRIVGNSTIGSFWNGSNWFRSTTMRIDQRFLVLGVDLRRTLWPSRAPQGVAAFEAQKAWLKFENALHLPGIAPFLRIEFLAFSNSNKRQRIIPYRKGWWWYIYIYISSPRNKGPVAVPSVIFTVPSYLPILTLRGCWDGVGPHISVSHHKSWI